ncbi:MAG: diphthamide biosynthesis enzyme Dph2 [Candidatus Methanomethylophilaceae archaeon]|jgi:2-(3-amino-3-carboxypropyl)histidine synthase
MFDLEPERVTAWIKSNGYSKVAVQLPEGLKVRSSEISDTLRSAGAIPILIGRPCYGACDYYDGYGEFADALIHYGHSAIPSMGEDPNVLFVEARAEVGADALRNHLDGLPSKIGVLASVQYIGLIDAVTEILEESERTAFVSPGDSRIKYPGQVLGCNCSAAENIRDCVDAFLFLGEGDFHPLAAAFGTDIPLFVYNPVTGSMRSVENTRERILRKRFASITIASEAESFTVIVCSKKGQKRIAEAERISALLEKAGKKVYTVVLEEITPEALSHYRTDAFVNTACPRISMDESSRFVKPILTVTEAEIVAGIRKWEDYEFDSIRN